MKYILLSMALLTFFFIFGCTTESDVMPHTDSEMMILVDEQSESYTVFYGITENTLEQVEKDIAEKEYLHLVPLEDFGSDLSIIERETVVYNEFDELEAIKGIYNLVQKYPEAPFGLTWNGGIAFTFNDYRYSEKIYESYLADFENYEANKLNPRQSPINPQAHIVPLLGS